MDAYYADKAGFEEYYLRTHGYSLRGERVYVQIPGTHFARTSVVAAIKEGEFGGIVNPIVAPFASSGYMNSDLFVGWLEQVFIPNIENPKN